MAPVKRFCIIAIASVMMAGWMPKAGAATDGSASSTSSTSAGVAPDGTPIVHKSLHKKKTTDPTAATTGGIPTASSVTVPTSTYSGGTSSATTSLLGPAVETGVPVARHGDSEYVASASVPSGMQNGLPHSSTMANILPLSSTPGSTTSAANSTVVDNSLFVDYTKKPTHTFPWKTGIYTTMFYIGEGGSSISSTTNVSSSWDAEWLQSNRGSDNPYDRSGYAPSTHAATLNPFYIALPFNDMVYPDKARQWVPGYWHRPNKDGKPVSACKDRWVEIKAEDGSGHVCYAQWEDVGPLRYDHAEYVFGPERPDTLTRAGLDVSPAVYQFLGLSENKHPTTRWRFVDDEDVPPGAWLKYEEQAVIYNALHDLKSARPTATPSMQRASEPIPNESTLEENQKKVGAAKG
jgi:hypothetical protein